MSLRPIFDKAAHALRIPLFGIDMRSQNVLMDKLGIDEVPTLLIYRNGKAPVVYGGVQNAKAIVDYVKILAKGAAVKLPSESEIYSQAKVYATKSSELEFPPSNAIDDDTFSTWISASSLPVSLVVSFKDAQKFFGYTLDRPSGGEESVYLQPGAWKIYASTDDIHGKTSQDESHWELLDTRSPGCLPQQSVSYCFDDTMMEQEYKHYKIQFSSNAGARTKHEQNSVAISNFKLHNGECQYKTFDSGEFCEKLPDQQDFNHPMPFVGRHENFACYVKGGFDNARAEIITGLLITAEADKAEYVIDDVAHGIRSVYDMQATRTAMEEVMKAYKYDIEIEYGHPNALCESSKMFCERQVWKCSPVDDDKVCNAQESKIYSDIRSQFLTSKANTADCHGAYQLDYLRYKGFASSSLVIKLNRAFHMNEKILRVVNEITEKLPEYFACIFYDSTSCSEIKQRKERKKCYQQDIQNKMGVHEWESYGHMIKHVARKQGKDVFGSSQKTTVFIHSQNHKLSSDAILHSKKSIWELMKKGKPPKIPKAMKPLNANDYKFMAMNVERDHKGQRQEDKKRKNVPRTVKFIEDVIDAFSLSNKNNEDKLRSSGVKPEKFIFKSLEDYIWVRAGADFRNEIAQRRDDEARGAIAWQVCTSASSLWVARSPFGQTLASYICGKLNSRMEYGKKIDSSGGNNANISLSDVYNKCDLQYKGKQNEWIEINVY
eukprot:g9511.t1